MQLLTFLCVHYSLWKLNNYISFWFNPYGRYNMLLDAPLHWSPMLAKCHSLCFVHGSVPANSSRFVEPFQFLHVYIPSGALA